MPFGEFPPFCFVSNFEEINFCYVAQKVMSKCKRLMLKKLLFVQFRLVLRFVAIAKKAKKRIATFQYLRALELL